MVVAVFNATTDQYHALACLFAPTLGENTPLTGSASTLPIAVWAQPGVLGATTSDVDFLVGAIDPVFGTANLATGHQTQQLL